MYQSRYHLTNGLISIAVDALNGEMLEFVCEKTADNVLKNYPTRTRGILDGMIAGPEGCKRFFVPRYQEIRRDPGLAPRITVEQGKGEAKLTVSYPKLVSDGQPVEISATISVALLRDDCRSRWKLKLDNRTGYEVDDIAFPSIDGVWLGESWQDDVLVYPHFAGCRIDNPTEQLASEPEMIRWKWQEYVFSYKLGQETGTKDERGAYVRRLNYSGEASMLWMDLFKPAENTGLYITCRNTGLVMKSLRMEAFGRTDPGTGLAIIHRPALINGTWTSEECILALHPGDWHWAADDYRAWFSALNRPDYGHHRPDWIMKSPGLMAHYDFQYQGGGIVHTFRDIPALLTEARKVGIDHLLLSGWNEDGFDYGFPHYKPNPRLGTEQELKQAVAEVRRDGGHVSFYVNSRLCNTSFEDVQQRIRDSAVMQRDGRLWIEKYGADDISFASLCIGDEAWRDELAETVRYLTHDIGADSMYLDQFAMATSVKCYHPGHKGHEGNPCAWNQGYLKLLEKMIGQYDKEGMGLIYEGCNDAFGPYSSVQLISELHCPFKGRMPQVYKYTFPDQILADMMNPRRHSAMRPEHVARHSTELLHNAFTMGAYLWCYDLEWDNNWRSDEEQTTRLKKQIALRRAWLENYGQGTFVDTVGLLEVPRGHQVRCFRLEDGLLVVAGREGGMQGRVRVAWNGSEAAAEMMTSDRPEPAPCETTVSDGTAVLTLPPAEEAVICIRLRL